MCEWNDQIFQTTKLIPPDGKSLMISVCYNQSLLTSKISQFIIRFCVSILSSPGCGPLWLFVFSPDIIPSGWLGSKHQLTNSLQNMCYCFSGFEFRNCEYNFVFLRETDVYHEMCCAVLIVLIKYLNRVVVWEKRNLWYNDKWNE